jgi:hypothetical protein
MPSTPRMSNLSPACARSVSLLLSLLLVAFCFGCRVFKSATSVPGAAARAVTPGKRDNQNFDPVEVQERLLRFSDVFLAQMTTGIDRVRRGTNTLAPAEALHWKIAVGTKTCAIASGPNAVGDLLDMTAFVSVVRAAIEEHWEPKVFGDSARPVLESCRDPRLRSLGPSARVSRATGCTLALRRAGTNSMRKIKVRGRLLRSAVFRAAGGCSTSVSGAWSTGAGRIAIAPSRHAVSRLRNFGAGWVSDHPAFCFSAAMRLPISNE